MDTSINLQASGEASFLLNKLVLESLPKDFNMRSRSSRLLIIDPAVPCNIAMKEFEDYELITKHESQVYISAWLKLNQNVIYVECKSGGLHIDVMSSDYDAKNTVDELAKKFDKYRSKNVEPDGVWVDFVYLTANGVMRSTEYIRCPKWADILENYPSDVSDEIGKLINNDAPWYRGRLAIWSGDPGTGKTYAIRALMMKWREMFDFVVVTDPERFANEPDYYYRVASESFDSHRAVDIEVCTEGVNPTIRAPYKKRTLFILEDAADLVLTQSRERHFDKFGKLLNMTDGLFGQGREDLFLLTFNERAEDVDPAFLRPGRCVARTEFTLFERDAATKWLIDHGIDHPVKDDMTLAQMYSILLDKQKPNSTHLITNPMRRTIKIHA
jgi:hypothetical protein